jgi:hypothetical protein
MELHSPAENKSELIFAWALNPGPGAWFDISGTTRELEECFITAHVSTVLPTNYLDMLGVLPPTNSQQMSGLKPWPRK